MNTVKKLFKMEYSYEDLRFALLGTFLIALIHTEILVFSQPITEPFIIRITTLLGFICGGITIGLYIYEMDFHTPILFPLFYSVFPALVVLVQYESLLECGYIFFVGFSGGMLGYFLGIVFIGFFSLVVATVSCILKFLISLITPVKEN